LVSTLGDAKTLASRPYEAKRLALIMRKIIIMRKRPMLRVRGQNFGLDALVATPRPNVWPEAEAKSLASRPRLKAELRY